MEVVSKSSALYRGAMSVAAAIFGDGGGRDPNLMSESRVKLFQKLLIVHAAQLYND